ncbi:MAG: elongation factor G [Nitrospira sp.]|nr:elongation factor G [Nitrospira sp.]HQY59415.1 elongation factor G [Nitrospira sp.]
MNVPLTESIRNVAVVSHAGSGKTSLVEALAYCAGSLSAPGSIFTGTTVSDFEPEEIHHRTSVNTAVLRCSYHDHLLQLLDTPGSPSFIGETRSALRVADGVVLVVSAVTGVRSALQRLWSMIREAGLPCVVFVNDLDKDDTVFDNTVEALTKELEMTAVPLILPMGNGAQLGDTVDLLQNRVVTSRPDHSQSQQEPVPPEWRDRVDQARRRVTELVAEGDEALLERYLTDGALTEEALLEGLRAGVQRGLLVPIVGGSALRQIGVHSLLQTLVDLLPSPTDRARVAPLQGEALMEGGEPVNRQPRPSDPFSAVVFKTLIDPFVGRLSYVRVYSGTLESDTAVYNSTRQVRERGGHLFSIFGKKYTPITRAVAGEIVAIGKLKDSLTGDTLCDEHAPVRYPGIPCPRPVVSFAIDPKSKTDIEKVSLGLHKLIEEDPSLEFVRHLETKEMVLSGMGQLHIDVALEKLHRKYGAEVIVHAPKIPYRETIRSVAQAQGKYKKQTGGHGQYGDCWLEVGPLPRGQGFEFENKIVGGAIPRNFVPAVEKGVVEALHEGPLAGYPAVDVRVTVYDGSYHVVDSSELAFKIAGSMGVKKALESAHPILLEPLMTVEVEVPAECVGAVLGDLNARRGRIVLVEANGHIEIVKALVPQAEMLNYAASLNSLTGGQGSYAMEYAQYEEVPRELAGRIVEEHKMERHGAVAH